MPKKKILNYFLFFAASFLVAKNALAVCPLCTIAVTAGVGLSRWLGIDDTITGLWLGGLIISMVNWTENWLEKKNIRFRGRILVDLAFYYAIILIPLYYSGIIGNSSNALYIFSLDKLFFGIIVGSISFWAGASWYFYLKEKNGNHAYFPFQKVVMPLAPLIILSIMFYFLIK